MAPPRIFALANVVFIYLFISCFLRTRHIKFKNDYKRPQDYNLKSPGGQFQNYWTHSNNGFMMLHPTGLREEQKKNSRAYFQKLERAEKGEGQSLEKV